MLAAKLLWVFVGNVSLCTLLTSLGLLKDWDPSHVWRLENKSEFYLTTCRNRKEASDGPNSRWINSDLSIYLIFKDKENISKASNGAQLQLIGRGANQRFKGAQPEYQIKYKNQEDLHQLFESEKQGQQNRFALSVGETGRNWLGEGGGGVESSEWGLQMFCDENLFQLKADRTSKNESHLSKISFKLDDCGSVDYKGIKGCLIKIEDNGTPGDGHNKSLDWVDTFKPIVISHSII